MRKRSGTTDIRIIAGVVIGLAIVVSIVAVVRLDTTGRSGSGLGQEYLYDINELAKVDPNLIIYRQSAAPIKTGFDVTHALFVDSNGVIYVAGDKAVRTFRQTGDAIGEIELGGEPISLTVAGDGAVYVGLKDHVEVYDARGKKLASWESLGDRALLTSIAVAQDDVFVADAGNRIVVRYDKAGKIVNHIGKRDADRNTPGFLIPSPHFDLAVSADGLLRVANPGLRRIEAYTPDGGLEFWWGKNAVTIEGFCGCCNPVSFAILPDGGFVTCEKGLVRVKLYDSDGDFVGVVASPAQLVREVEFRICNTPQECQSPAFDVAVDAEGRVYVLDTNEDLVRVFTRKGPDE